MAAGPTGQVVLQLPFSAASAARARAALQGWMHEHGCAQDLVEDARLVATELVGNAVRHAHPIDPDGIVVSWERSGDDLVISVADGGSGTIPRQRSAPPEATDGRGLAIVDALVRRWWVERRGARSAVHAVLPLRTLLPSA